MYRRMMTLALALSAISATALAGSWFRGGPPSDPLSQAHRAFLEGDYLTMDLKIKEVLMTPNLEAVTMQNAMALLEKGYEATGGNLPADWKLPPEIRKLKFFERRSHRDDGDVFGLKITGNLAEGVKVRQLTVVRYPNQVVLDKANGIGGWTEEEDRDEGPEFELHNLNLSEPPADGLYTAHFELENGRQVEAWFPVSHLLSSQTPTITTPTAEQVFHDARPRFEWVDFRSPELASFETRGVWVAAWGDDVKSAWERYMEAPKVTSICVGDGGVGNTSLADGRYSFIVAYRELRRFGGVRLARQSLRSVEFHVKHAR